MIKILTMFPSNDAKFQNRSIIGYLKIIAQLKLS